MAYTPLTWVDDVTAVSAAHMNHIEGGISDAHTALAASSVIGSNGRARTITATLLGTTDPDKNNNLAIALAYAVVPGAGSNGGRDGGGGNENLLTSESANSGATTPPAEFFAMYYSNITVTEPGSHQAIWNQMNVNEGDVADTYNESVLYFGSMNTNRRGVLAECMELGNLINAGKPARATVATLGLIENNAIGAYTAEIFGASSPWIDTGARALWIINGGSQAGGTGIYLDGTFMRSIYAKPSAYNNTIFASRVQGETHDRAFQWADGSLFWGPGDTDIDVSLRRTDAFSLTVGGNLFVSNSMVITGDLAIGNDWTTHVDAAVNGYISVVIDGTARKIPTIA